MYPFELCFSPDICLEVGLEDHMVTLFLVSQRISLLFSIVAVPIYSPINTIGGFFFSTLSSAFIVCRFFDVGHSDQCEVIPHCSFDLHFSNN